MKKMHRIIAVVIVLAVIALSPFADAYCREFTQQDREDIAKVEAYINSITTLQSRFLQVASDGSQYNGMFYLKRPGRMRIQYDPPNGNYVTSDGIFIYFWDDEMKQQSNTLISSTLAGLVLRKNISLSGDIEVTNIVRGDDTLAITAVQSKEPGQGSITLVFDSADDKLSVLRKWKVVDAQNIVTEFTLLSPEAGVPLASSMFSFHKPDSERWK